MVLLIVKQDFVQVKEYNMAFLSYLLHKFAPKAFYPAYDGAGHGKRIQNWAPTSASINSILASNAGVLRK